MKIGVFGGTFNPVHYGHIRTAEKLMDQAKLDQILFVVAGKPPHKPGENIAEKEDRLQMVKMAVQGRPGFAVSDLEIKNDGYSYTIDTLERLSELYPQDQLFFITGADMFVMVPTWHEGERLLMEYSFIAVNRNSSFENKQYRKKMEQLIKTYGVHVEIVDIDTPNISSSMIRHKIKNGSGIDGLVPEKVRKYLLEHDLYK